MKEIVKYISAQKEVLTYNNQIFEITEGNLLKYLKAALGAELRPENLADAMTRAAPVNVLRKIFSKLTKLYAENPIRITENQANQELIDYYINASDINTHFNNANFNFNAYKNTAIEIYHNEKKRKLEIRSLPSMQFLPHSNDTINPLEATEIIKIMGKVDDKNIFWVYSDAAFVVIDEEGNVLNSDTENPYEVLPFTYINRSAYTLIPTVDTDTVQMAVLIGKLLVDINFSSKYLANPIVYGVDVDIENLERSPNVFWNVKSNGEKTPEINVVKAEADIEAQMQSLLDQVSLWLQTRDIRVGTVGNFSGDRAASGLSLMIQEMDTTENVKNQKKYFEKAENDFWKRLGLIHNYLADHNLIDVKQKFVEPENMVVVVNYPEQTIVEDISTTETRIVSQYSAGVLSLSEAITRLNPKWTQEQIDQLVDDINKTKVITIGENIPIQD